MQSCTVACQKQPNRSARCSSFFLVFVRYAKTPFCTSSDAAANKTAEETAQTVGSSAIDCEEPIEARSARWIGNEHPKLQGIVGRLSLSSHLPLLCCASGVVDTVSERPIQIQRTRDRESPIPRRTRRAPA